MTQDQEFIEFLKGKGKREGEVATQEDYNAFVKWQNARARP